MCYRRLPYYGCNCILIIQWVIKYTVNLRHETPGLKMSPAPLTGYVNTVELKLFSFFLSFLVSGTVKANKASHVCF